MVVASGARLHAGTGTLHWSRAVKFHLYCMNRDVLGGLPSRSCMA
jgi:hypothetical protein